jgi:catechol-2,3-dioxygenase
MLRPTALAEAHLECKDVSRSVGFLTSVLNFEKLADGDRSAALQHSNTPWLLVLHEAEANPHDQPFVHHLGVRVEHASEVDAAWQYLHARKGEHGVSELRAPEWAHGSYSLYLWEPGGNGWEIECFEKLLTKEQAGQRLGGVRSRHWDTAAASETSADRGFQVRAFTHGTLHTDDAATYGSFVSVVLGLEVHQAYKHVVYTKHPETKHYVVCIQLGERNAESGNFRFTLGVESPRALEEAHAWLSAGAVRGVSQIFPIQEDDQRRSFLLRDLDNNCWEVAYLEPA